LRQTETNHRDAETETETQTLSDLLFPSARSRSSQLQLSDGDRCGPEQRRCAETQKHHSGCSESTAGGGERQRDIASETERQQEKERQIDRQREIEGPRETER
jgi:hypothetical protein